MKGLSSLHRIATRFWRPARNVLIGAAVLWVVVIRLYNVLKIDEQNARISSTIESFSELIHGQTAADLALAHHFAVLSAAVYENDRKWVPGCQYEAVLEQWKPLDLPDSIPTRPKDADRGRARPDSPLEYGVWYRDSPAGSRFDVDVVIAFRGTDGPRDFWSNLRWLTRFFSNSWDQYDLTRTVAPAIEEHVAKRFAGKKPRIIATGHSLGGGLAQQAGYAASNIKVVYAFDSSSVTGFYDVNEAVRDKAKVGMRVYRLNERGEILQYLRGFMSLIYPVAEKNPQIVQVTYNANTGNPFRQHSIHELACALIRANGTPKVEAGLVH